MTTYIYETVTSKPGETPKHYEIRQSMNDKPLAKHPETGEPIRRVVVGGLGVLKKGEGAAPSSGGSGCGTRGCGCH